MPADTTNIGVDSASAAMATPPLALNANTSLSNPTNPSCATVGDSCRIAAYRAPASTVLLFEVANSKDYDITTEINPAGGNPPGTATYCGGSPAGNGLGGAYEPNGYNSQRAGGRLRPTAT